MFLERRVSELEKDSTANIEVHTRLRQENLQLVHRANALEEQLKDQEARAEDSLQLEMRRQKEAICKLERERGMELENLQARSAFPCDGPVRLGLRPLRALCSVRRYHHPVDHLKTDHSLSD